jgi:hypothetical protein
MYCLVANAEAQNGARQQSNQSMQRRLLYAWLLVALLTICGVSQPVQAQVFAGGRTRVIEANRQKANYFAVMGFIKHPKAYVLPTKSPSLVDFIRFAGGLTKGASTGGQVRIVRNGRVAQIANFNPRSTVRLMPGDLIVVDGKIGGGTIFRGGQSNQQSEKKIQIGLVGVLDYPVILEVKPDFATISWVTRQLGQLPKVAAATKAIVPRRFSKVDSETLLGNNTILVFAQGLIDKTRLPDLPRPFDPDKDRHPQATPNEVAQVTPPARTNQGSAAPPRTFRPRPAPVQRPPANVQSPGHSPVTEPAPPISDPNEDRAVRDLLADPNSVKLDPERYIPSGSARVNEPGRVRIQNGATNGPPDILNRDQQQATQRAEPKPAPSRPPREAEKPFESFRDSDAASKAAPVQREPEPTREPKQQAASDDEPTSLGLTRVIDPPFASQPANEAADNRQRPNRIQTSPVDVQLKNAQRGTDQEVLTKEQLNAAAQSGGPSFAHQGANRLGSNPRPTVERTPLSSGDGPDQNTTPRKRIALTGPIMVQPRVTEPVVAQDQLEKSNSEESQAALAGGSRILNKPTTPTSVPKIIISTIGGVGLFVAACMLLLMLRPTNTPDPIADEEIDDAGYLDRLINNEMEIVETEPQQAAMLRLFGKPTPETMLRVDNAHTKIRRPHFMNRGDQRGTADHQPDTPDLPIPDSIDTDFSQPGLAPGHRQQPIESPTRSPIAPVRPAAATATATRSTEDTRIVQSPTDEQPLAADAQDNQDSSQRRSIRVDDGHAQLKPARTRQPNSPLTKGSAPQRTANVVSVQPAPALTQGSDILDRVLATMQKGQQ